METGRRHVGHGNVDPSACWHNSSAQARHTVCRHGNAFGTLLVASYGVKQMMQLRASTIWDSCLLGFEEAMIFNCKLILQKVIICIHCYYCSEQNRYIFLDYSKPTDAYCAVSKLLYMKSESSCGW